MTQLAVFCDMQHAHQGDAADLPVALLRNVTLFCRSGGLQGVGKAFSLPSSLLHPCLAHALISVVCNVKLWLNFRAIVQLFYPVRSSALSYVCSLDDQELRSQSARNIADFLWCSVRDNGGAAAVAMQQQGGAGEGGGGLQHQQSLLFDKDGLDLALKYFMSSTLTIRLAGINQINTQITAFNELCHGDSVVEAESVGLRLSAWLLQNRVVEHLFGPNLHVEVVKQSHVLLTFLAMEGKITSDHVDAIWQAAQLMHCARQVHDILLPLIKNLEAGPVLHLFSLVRDMPVKDHTVQTIHLAQILQRFIWSNGGALGAPAAVPGNAGLLGVAAPIPTAARRAPAQVKAAAVSSSDDDDGDDEDEDESEEVHRFPARQHRRGGQAVRRGGGQSRPPVRGCRGAVRGVQGKVRPSRAMMERAELDGQESNFSMDEELVRNHVVIVQF